MMAEFDVQFEPFGPSPATLARASSALLKNRALRNFLGDAETSLISFELVDEDSKAWERCTPPSSYRATVFDYTNNRTVVAEGRLRGEGDPQISELGSQPLPSHEEFCAAVEILSEDAEVADLLRREAVTIYRPMPPLLEEGEGPDGRVQRTLAVGLMPSGSGGAGRHEIVGVNMIDRTVVHFDECAPPTAVAHNPICGLPYAAQATVPLGTPGLAWVTVTQGSTVLWRFLVVRPSASSGTRSSGVEVRFVDYLGKRVLYRGHVPILNVLYDNNVCGPYRDWQWQEGMFEAKGANPVPGFRLCANPAQTIIDSGNDTGNFSGVAVYIDGQEVVLVSELEAGWYRYISEWRFHADGTIRPRFGFSAVQSSCVCTVHHHHPYWRLDFDIRTAGNNVVREFNDPPIFPGTNWHTKHFEIKRYRDPARKRKWRIENAATGEGYTLVPGSNDGVADSYARGDVWILRYHGSELDDGHNQTSGPPGVTEADLDQFVNGEVVLNSDVVVWYAAHITHDVGAEPPGTFGHWCGPDLQPHNW
jgi:hypothetical protein